MLQSLLKKKLSEEQMANIFINGLLEVIESSFPLLIEMINEDTAFVRSPNILASNDAPFALIVFAANLNLLESTFEPQHASAIEKSVIKKLAGWNNETSADFGQRIRDYQSFINRVNRPSKNLVYGMSKSIFVKYELSQFQDEYFRRLNAPSPLFLARLNEITKLFVWDWDEFFKKYKL
ncbi:MAG: hypothetical protein ACI9G9_001662 [Psychromonas sp.]|jgi:hypothetical protein